MGLGGGEKEEGGGGRGSEEEVGEVVPQPPAIVKKVITDMSSTKITDFNSSLHNFIRVLKTACIFEHFNEKFSKCNTINILWQMSLK